MPFLWTVNKNALVIRDIALTRSSEWARGTVRVSLNILGDLLFFCYGFFWYFGSKSIFWDFGNCSFRNNWNF